MWHHSQSSHRPAYRLPRKDTRNFTGSLTRPDFIYLRNLSYPHLIDDSLIKPSFLVTELFQETLLKCRAWKGVGEGNKLFLKHQPTHSTAVPIGEGWDLKSSEARKGPVSCKTGMFALLRMLNCRRTCISKDLQAPAATLILIPGTGDQ